MEDWFWSDFFNGSGCFDCGLLLNRLFNGGHIAYASMFLFFLSAKGGGVSHSNNIILFRRKNYNSEILTLNSVVEGE